jgi:predicted Zn-dependent protease with MMP-like domain
MAIEMSRERFEELVADALDEVPEELMRMLDNVVVLVEDDSPEDPPLLGLYEGIDLTRRGWDYGAVLPDRIFIFRNPILGICDTEDDEIAHHFGIDDERLHALGWG